MKVTLQLQNLHHMSEKSKQNIIKAVTVKFYLIWSADITGHCNHSDRMNEAALSE